MNRECTINLIARSRCRPGRGTLAQTAAAPQDSQAMCRNIKMLFNFDPPATEDEVRLAALQFVRKISGSTRPARNNAVAFDVAVQEVTEAALRLIGGLTTTAPPRDRLVEAERAKERTRLRFARDLSHELPRAPDRRRPPPAR